MKRIIPAALLGAGLIVTSQACSTTLYVMSVGNSDVQVIINGSLVRTLVIGETLPEGVSLRSIENNIAVFDIDGKVVRFGLGQSTTSQAVLQIGRDGHFRTAARINGVPVAGLIDTGATNVIIGSATATRLGINFRSGPLQIAQIPNGRIVSYLVVLARVEVGDIVVSNVACNVLEGAQIAPDLEVLIGNSFLSQVQMQRSGNTMTLSRNNGL